ncbi:MAG TPA: pyrimidine reductase family protein [Acidimicrobiales bacterium]|nr:pyrimidine reductase family protein [Acidimicrobiales bacterium]
MLLPEPSDDVDLVTAYAPTDHGSGRPFVRCNMISTLDGAVTVAGRSGMLGGPADRRVFQVLRSLADVILVGAGTVRAEAYGPARLDEEAQQRRNEQGRAPVPPIAVVTRSGNLDWASPFFTEARARPIVFSSDEADEGTRRRAAEVAEFVVAGDRRVDPARALDHLRAKGFRSVLLEGGPGLNADVVDAGLLDELCLTVAPRLVAGSGPRVLSGPELALPVELRCVHLLEEDGYLFGRFALAGNPAD